MGELNDDVLEEARSRSEILDIHDLIEIMEVHRVDGGGGVSRETVGRYAEALDYDPEEVEEMIEERLIDAEEWTEGDVFYRLEGDRISNYPPQWHERLADTTDLTEHVGLIHSSVTATEGDEHTAVTDAGVPETKVVRVARAITGLTRDDAYSMIQDQRKKGQLEEHASQHPDPRVQLPDEE